MDKKTDLLQGTLDLLILRTIALEPMHGWAISPNVSSKSRRRRFGFSKARSIRLCTGSNIRA